MFFANNIKYLRKKAGISQGQLAKVLDVTSQAVTGWETGKSVPYFNVLLRLREYFGIDLESLVYLDLEEGKVDSVSNTPMHPDELSALRTAMDGLVVRMNALEKKVDTSKQEFKK